MNLDINRHPYEDTPDGTCARCGYVRSFGALHRETPDSAEDGYELPQVCRACFHIDHGSSKCGVGMGSGRFAVACRCGERGAA